MSRYIPTVLLLCHAALIRGQTDIEISTDVTPSLELNSTYDFLMDEYFNLDHCALYPLDPYVSHQVRLLVENNVKLMEYSLAFPNYTTNPLMVNMTVNHRPTTWARVTQQHGQTLLALAFNYGVLSLMTLTFGVENLEIDLQDQPPGCIWTLGEEEKINAVLYLLMRDFQNGTGIVLKEQERICHEIIVVDEDDYARFKDQCCTNDVRTGSVGCTTDIISIWLTILRIMLNFVRYGIIFFGPLWFVDTMETLARERQPYKVVLKEPLKKTIILAKSDTPITVEYDKVLDFKQEKRFRKLKESAKEFPLGVPTKVKFTEYDILVGYDRLLTENDVPVGLWTQISRSLFLCKIKNVGPFVKCCARNMFSTCPKFKGRPWIKFWKKLGLILLIFFLPTPLYIRLLVFYKFEGREVYGRKSAIAKIGAKETYENSLIHYWTPTHGLFIFMYCIYFITAIILGYLSTASRKGKFKNIIVGSFMDLKKIRSVDVLAVLVGNIIWPFQRYGWTGCLICLIYWPIAVPLSLVIFACYCLPSVYLTLRMIFYSKTGLLYQMKEKNKDKIGYRRLKKYDESMQLFETSRLLGDGDHPTDTESLAEEEEDKEIHGGDDVELGLMNNLKAEQVPEPTLNSSDTKVKLPFDVREVVEHIGASVLCVITMFAVLLLLSECVGALVEMLVFTTMGIIVNAGQVLKYVTLLLLVILYSYDCFNNVGKKYLKLNKALFGELKGRIKDLADVTRLPSHLQENSGFKSEELSEQAEGELPDEVCVRKGRCREWMINDLVLFVDNEDFPRIPRELFQDICQIRVAGAPGPVYQSHIDAFKQFLVILCFLLFVFIVVLSFGAVYQISSTNQMMATLAGGFMPFILKTFMQPQRPDLELGSVSFKSKLDEIIRRFHQKWRIHDFPFEPWTEEDEEAEREKEREDNGEEEEKTETESVGVQTETLIDSSTVGYSALPNPPSYDRAAELPTTNNINHLARLPTVTVQQPPEGHNASSGSETSEITKVDYVIYIPERCDTKWLQEWSDLDVEENPDEEELSEGGDTDTDDHEDEKDGYKS